MILLIYVIYSFSVFFGLKISGIKIIKSIFNYVYLKILGLIKFKIIQEPLVYKFIEQHI